MKTTKKIGWKGLKEMWKREDCNGREGIMSYGGTERRRGLVHVQTLLRSWTGKGYAFMYVFYIAFSILLFGKSV